MKKRRLPFAGRSIVGLVGALSLAGSALPAAASTVSFWYYGSTKDVNLINGLIADFEKANPDIKIDLTVTKPPDWSKWIAAVAAGEPPDVSMGNANIFNALGGALQPLDGLIASSTALKPSNFFPAVWNLQKYDGKQMALPFRANSQVIFYNTQLFADAGLTGAPTSWDQIAVDAQKLTRKQDGKTEQFGFTFRNAQLNRTVNYFAGYNGWVPFDQGYHHAYFSDSKLVDTLAFLSDLVQHGDAILPGQPYAGAPGVADGKVGMAADGPWVLSGITPNHPDLQMAAFQLPAGPSGAQPYAIVDGENLVMFKAAKDKAAALKWMEYLVYTRNVDYNQATGAFLPVVRSIAGDTYWSANPIWAAVLKNFDVGALPPNALGAPCGVTIHAVQPDNKSPYDQALEAILRKGAPIATSLQTVQQVATGDVDSPDLATCAAR